MMEASLLDRLQRLATERPDAPAMRFTTEEGSREWTWSGYWRAALAAAEGLARVGVRSGDHVFVLELEPQRGAAILLGLWALGAVPTHLGVPPSPDGIAAYVAFVARIARRWSVRTLVANDALTQIAASQEVMNVVPSSAALDGSGDLERSAPSGHLALVQLSSGTTAEPKGVEISHANLLRHLEVISAGLPADDVTWGVTWLPLYHDMGLIGGLLYPLYNGFPVAVMSPARFLQRPLRWLEAISELSASITCAPPSAFASLLRFAPAAQQAGIDLRSVRCAMVGAEPILPRVLRSFAEAFAPCGFSARAFFPVYGLAEATVAVTFPMPGEGPMYRTVSRRGLWRGRIEPPMGADDEEELTALGEPLSGVSLRIVDSERGDCKPEVVGELWVKTESGMDGYHLDPDATREVRPDEWLRTGDLGFTSEGQLYVIGRSKDIVIKGGLNISPASIEDAVRAVDGVRSGGVVVVGVMSARRATERLFIVAESRAPVDAQRELRQAVVAAARSRGVIPDRVILVLPGTIPKTTSGKIMRGSVREMIARRELGP